MEAELDPNHVQVSSDSEDELDPDLPSLKEAEIKQKRQCRHTHEEETQRKLVGEPGY